MELNKKDETKYSIITIMVMLVLIAANIWVGRPILRQIERIKQKDRQKTTQMHVDSTWLTQLCIYELNKYHNIANMVLEDKEFMRDISENMDKEEALITIRDEIKNVEAQYLDDLHMWGEYNIINYILDNRDTTKTNEILAKWRN